MTKTKNEVLKELKSNSYPEVKSIFTKKRFVLTNEAQSRLINLVNIITQGACRSYSIEDGFSGHKETNSLTFYLANNDIEVLFTKAGKVKDFSVAKSSIDWV